MGSPQADAPCLGQLDAHLTALGIRWPGFLELEVAPSKRHPALLTDELEPLRARLEAAGVRTAVDRAGHNLLVAEAGRRLAAVVRWSAEDGVATMRSSRGRTNGWLNVDEIRAFEDMEPLPDGAARRRHHRRPRRRRRRSPPPRRRPDPRFPEHFARLTHPGQPRFIVPPSAAPMGHRPQREGARAPGTHARHKGGGTPPALYVPGSATLDGFQGRVALHALEIANGDATGEAHGYRLEFWSTASAATKGGVLDLQAQVDGPLFTVATGPFAAQLTSAHAGDRFAWTRSGVARGEVGRSDAGRACSRA